MLIGSQCDPTYPHSLIDLRVPDLVACVAHEFGQGNTFVAVLNVRDKIITHRLKMDGHWVSATPSLRAGDHSLLAVVARAQNVDRERSVLTDLRLHLIDWTNGRVNALPADLPQPNVVDVGAFRPSEERVKLYAKLLLPMTYRKHGESMVHVRYVWALLQSPQALNPGFLCEADPLGRWLSVPGTEERYVCESPSSDDETMVELVDCVAGIVTTLEERVLPGQFVTSPAGDRLLVAVASPRRCLREWNLPGLEVRDICGMSSDDKLLGYLDAQRALLLVGQPSEPEALVYTVFLDTGGRSRFGTVGGVLHWLCEGTGSVLFLARDRLIVLGRDHGEIPLEF
jgi:hypothetical protein